MDGDAFIANCSSYDTRHIEIKCKLDKTRLDVFLGGRMYWYEYTQTRERTYEHLLFVRGQLCVCLREYLDHKCYGTILHCILEQHETQLRVIDL